MKKIFAFLMCVGILMGLSGCGNENPQNNPNNANQEISVEDILASAQYIRITDENTRYRVENYGKVSLNKVEVSDKIYSIDKETYAEPTDGNKFVTFEFLFKNTEDNARNSNDIVDLTIYFNDGKQYKATKTLIALSRTKPELLENQDIGKDKEVKVYCGVEIPEDYSGEGTAVMDFGGKRYKVDVKS